MRMFAVLTLFFAACASPSSKTTRVATPPISSPDRCMAIVDVLCARVSDCAGEVAQGECVAVLEVGCQDAAGITQLEMDLCIEAIRALKCTDPLPAECQGIATSAADEPAPRQGEIRCER
jgi:hypothetical protein